MLDKGVIHKVVQWRRSREFLYWRLRRKILEASVAARIEGLNKRMKRRESLEMLRQWFIEDVGENNRFSWDKDGTVVDWLEEQVGDEFFYLSLGEFHFKCIHRTTLRFVPAPPAPSSSTRLPCRSTPCLRVMSASRPTPSVL